MSAVRIVTTLEAVIQQREMLREQGKKLVFTNGHFDLFHVGHLDYLEQARALGDALFVGVNSDDSTRQLKGEGRPIIPVDERIRLLSALRCVTAALPFADGENTADHLIQALQPDIYVKGGDYANKNLPERPTVEAIGGKVVLIDYLPNHSTTELIRRIKELPD